MYTIHKPSGYTIIIVAVEMKNERKKKNQTSNVIILYFIPTTQNACGSEKYTNLFSGDASGNIKACTHKKNMTNLFSFERTRDVTFFGNKFLQYILWFFSRILSTPVQRDCARFTF